MLPKQCYVGTKTDTDSFAQLNGIYGWSDEYLAIQDTTIEVVEERILKLPQLQGVELDVNGIRSKECAYLRT